MVNRLKTDAYRAKKKESKHLFIRITHIHKAYISILSFTLGRHQNMPVFADTELKRRHVLEKLLLDLFFGSKALEEDTVLFKTKFITLRCCVQGKK